MGRKVSESGQGKIRYIHYLVVCLVLNTVTVHCEDIKKGPESQVSMNGNINDVMDDTDKHSSPENQVSMNGNINDVMDDTDKHSSDDDSKEDNSTEEGKSGESIVSGTTDGENKTNEEDAAIKALDKNEPGKTESETKSETDGETSNEPTDTGTKQKNSDKDKSGTKLDDSNSISPTRTHPLYTKEEQSDKKGDSTEEGKSGESSASGTMDGESKMNEESKTIEPSDKNDPEKTESETKFETDRENSNEPNDTGTKQKNSDKDKSDTKLDDNSKSPTMTHPLHKTEEQSNKYLPTLSPKAFNLDGQSSFSFFRLFIVATVFFVVMYVGYYYRHRIKRHFTNSGNEIYYHPLRTMQHNAVD